MLLAMQAWKAPYLKRYDAKKTSLFPKTNCGLYIFDCMLTTTLKCTLYLDTANYFNKFMQNISQAVYLSLIKLDSMSLNKAKLAHWPSAIYTAGLILQNMVRSTVNVDFLRIEYMVLAKYQHLSILD